MACAEEHRYPPLWVDGAGHNNIEITCRRDESYINYLKKFVLDISSRESTPKLTETSVQA